MQILCTRRVYRYDQPAIMSQKSNRLCCLSRAHPSWLVVRLFDVAGDGIPLSTSELLGMSINVAQIFRKASVLCLKAVMSSSVA